LQNSAKRGLPIGNPYDRAPLESPLMIFTAFGAKKWHACGSTLPLETFLFSLQSVARSLSWLGEERFAAIDRRSVGSRPNMRWAETLAAPRTRIWLAPNSSFYRAFTRSLMVRTLKRSCVTQHSSGPGTSG